MSQYAIPLAIVLLCLCAVPVTAVETVSRTRYLMGTRCEIAAELSASGIDPAFDEISRVERLLSTWRDDTELARLNASGGHSLEISHELFDLLNVAVEWTERTENAFNPLVGPLVEVWNVRGTGAEPSDDQISDALRRSHFDAISLEPSERSVRLTAGSAIDEGGFGKGYALDRASDILTESGCNEYLIDFGGQLTVRSAAYRTIEIADPSQRDRPALSLRVRHASLATTSGSEKWFETSLGRLSHVIDPRNGRAIPPRGSVTVIHEEALVADILSTALYVMGPEEGLRWANEYRVAAIFIVPDGRRWTVFASNAGNNPVLGLTTVSDDFRLKGQH